MDEVKTYRDHQLSGTGDLARAFKGGEDDNSVQSLLFTLIAKVTPDSKYFRNLARAFPVHVKAYVLWMSVTGHFPTPKELFELLEKDEELKLMGARLWLEHDFFIRYELPKGAWIFLGEEAE